MRVAHSAKDEPHTLPVVASPAASSKNSDASGRGAPRTPWPNTAWYLHRMRKSLAELTDASIADGERLAVEDINFVERQTGMRSTWRVLEIGCGWGRHTVELARRGYHQVTSLDISPEAVAVARERVARAEGANASEPSDERGKKTSIETTDYLDFRPEQPVDIILSLYDRSCLGQPDETQDRCSLAHLSGMLAPGGYLIFGIRDWPLALPEPIRTWEESAEGIELHEVISDAARMVCTHRTTLVRPGGSRERYDLTRRHYSLPEVHERLADAGFAHVRAFHAFDDGRPYGFERQGMVIVARRVSASASPPQARATTGEVTV